MTRRISEGRSAAKGRWEADKCSKHFSYRLKGKAGTKRPIPMTSMKLLAARFYRLKSGHAPNRGYLLTKGFSPQAIGTKICTRLSGLGTEPISPPASGLVRKLFPRQPRAWYGDYFSAILELGAEAISPPSSGLVRKLFPHEPRA